MLKAIIFDLGNTLVSQESPRAFPHAVEVLEELKGRYRLALVTNTRSDMTTEDIEGLLREAGDSRCLRCDGGFGGGGGE